MNLDLSGHEMEHQQKRDPADWLNHAKAMSPTHTVTTDNMNGSLTSFGDSVSSLNIDNLTVVDLDHSYRGSPGVAAARVSSTSAHLADSTDAPWNNIITTSPTRSRMMQAPPPGVSALDHLQNSITSLMNIDETTTDGDLNYDADLEASLRLLDLTLPNTAPPHDRPRSAPRACTPMSKSDDDATEIIRLLNTQAKHLKEQLIAEQQRNLQFSASSNSSIGGFWEQGSTKKRNRDFLSADHRLKNNSEYASWKVSQTQVTGSMNALKERLFRRQQQVITMKGNQNEATMMTDEDNDDDQARLCSNLTTKLSNLQNEHEIAFEAQAKTFRNESNKQAARIAELERQLRNKRYY